MGPRNYWLGDDEDESEDLEEGAEPEEALSELNDPDVVDEQHPSTAAPDSDVPTPSPAKRAAPKTRRATRIISRPKAAIKRIVKKKPPKRAAKKAKRKRVVGFSYFP